jgi:phosphoribosylamine--glycine ligase
MRVLVVGSGGREHALVDAFIQSRSVTSVHCVPGNAGIAAVATVANLSIDDNEQLLAYAAEHRIDLTVIGPEAPLVNGVVDRFRRDGRHIFGPTRAAARLEGSKAFAKSFMERHRIPTARSRTFTPVTSSELSAYLSSIEPPIVVKADGLAAGKGVVIAGSRDEAASVARDMLSGSAFGEAGKVVVVEEFLQGSEASVFVLTDGRSYSILPAAQDHKRALDGDKGKNTGGMGAYAPAPVVTDELRNVIARTIVEPTLDGMRRDGVPYTGCLFVGLMFTPDDGPKVLEYNCRFGDPETQAVIPLLDCDLGAVFSDIASGSFKPGSVRVAPATAVCVVLASGGYPDAFEKGKVIRGLERASALEGVSVFHAGTMQDGSVVRTSGGRVLGVTAVGRAGDLFGTIQRAYQAVGMIEFEKMHYRRDIGGRAREYRVDSSR